MLHTGMKVKVSRTLASNPAHSDSPYGFMLEGTPVDARERVPCAGVGVLAQNMGQGVWAVAFADYPVGGRDRHTVAFAHEDDIECTGAPYAFLAPHDHVTVMGDYI